MSENLRLDTIGKAIKDYKYLIDKGYKWRSALNLVTGRYLLNRSERAFIFRAVHPHEVILNVKHKILKPEEISGLQLGIDGFNVLITLETMVKRELLIRCDDELLRDLQGLFLRYKISEYTYRALGLIEEFISAFNPSRTFMYLDRRKSKSGELARVIRFLTKNISVHTVEKADIKASESEVTATSDIVSATKAEKIVDIPKYFISRYVKNAVKLEYDGNIIVFNFNVMG